MKCPYCKAGAKCPGKGRCKCKSCVSTGLYKGARSATSAPSLFDEITPVIEAKVNRPKAIPLPPALNNQINNAPKIGGHQPFAKTLANIFAHDNKTLDIKHTLETDPEGNKEDFRAKYPEASNLPLSGHNKVYTVKPKMIGRGEQWIAEESDEMSEIIHELEKVSKVVDDYLEKSGGSENRKVTAELLGHTFTREEVEFWLAENSNNKETIEKLLNSESVAVRIKLTACDNLTQEQYEILACDAHKEVRLNAIENMAISKKLRSR